MQAIGRDDLASDPRLASNDGRDARRDELYGVIDRWVASQPLEEVLAVLARAEVPASRIYSAEDMFRDPQFLAREMFLSARLPDGKPFRMPGIVPKLSATPGSADCRPGTGRAYRCPARRAGLRQRGHRRPAPGRRHLNGTRSPSSVLRGQGGPSPLSSQGGGYPHASTSMAPSGKSRCTGARLRPDRPMRNAPSNETVLARRIQQHVIPLAEGRQHVFLHPPDQHLQFPANGLHGILEIAFVVQLHLGDDPLQQGFPCGSTSVTTRPPSGRGWLRVKGWGAKASASRCFRLSKSGLLFRRIRLVKDRKTRIGFVDASIYRTNGSIWRKATCRRK